MGASTRGLDGHRHADGFFPCLCFAKWESPLPQEFKRAVARRFLLTLVHRSCRLEKQSPTPRQPDTPAGRPNRRSPSVSQLVPRSSRMWRIMKGLYLGDRRDAHDRHLLVGMGITHILNCAHEVPCWYRRDFRYYHLKLTDPDPEFHEYIEAICRFIR